MRLHYLVAAAVLVTASVAVRADTITSFQLDATLSNGKSPAVTGTLNGTVSIDTTTGTVTADDLTLVAFGGTYTFTKRPDLVVEPPTLGITFYASNVLDALYLQIPQGSLLNYTGSSLCSVDSLCALDASPGATTESDIEIGSKDADVLSGSLEPEVAATPEPSSFVLLGTGLLGVTGVMRKRFA